MDGLVGKLGLLVGALCLVACGDGLAVDEAAAGDEGFGSDGGGGQDAGGTDGEDDGDGDESDGANEPDADGTGGSTPSDDGGGEDGLDEGLCNADCGPAGVCLLDDEGVPACSCADGSVAYGMRCVPCVKTDSAADIMLERADLQLTVYIEGELPPDNPYERARIWLRDRASGDEILAGETTEGTLNVSVLPGTYDVMYDRIAGGGIVPRNNSALVIEQLVVSESAAFDVDLPVVTLHGDFTLGGDAAPDNPYENGQVVLVDRATGDEVVLGKIGNGDYSVRVLPGDYEMHYRRSAGGTLVPRNGDAYFDDVVVEVLDGRTDMVLDVDVPFVEIDGTLLLDGATPPTAAYENASISLLDPDTGDEFPIAETNDGVFNALVVPGTYDVVYSRKVGGTIVPVNADAVLDTVTIDVGGPMTIDIHTTNVSGSFTVDGGPVALGPSEDAIVSLVDDVTGDEIPLGNLSAGGFDRIVLAGSYTVSYGQLSAAGTLPANTGAQLTPLTLAPGIADGEVIDVSTAQVSGTILLAGAQPPTSEYSDGRLYLRNTATGDSVLLGNTRMGNFSGTVVPGTYDVVYVVETAGTGVPVNSESKLLEGIVVDGVTPLDIDIPVFDFAGTVALAGEAPPSSASDRAQLLMQDVVTDDVIYLGGTDAGSFAQRLTGGTYLVVYEGLQSSGLMPQNTRAGVGCVILTSEE